MPNIPVLIFTVLGAARPGAPPAGLGGGPRADRCSCSSPASRRRRCSPAPGGNSDDDDATTLRFPSTWRLSRSPRSARRQPPAQREVVFDVDDLRSRTAARPPISGVNLEIYRNLITAVIGPSGCGKSTFIRCLNRMNDLVPGATDRGPGALPRRRTSTATDVDPVEVRRRIGMVFQRANPFPKSIYDNVAWGAARARDEEGPRRAGREGPHAAPRSGTRSRTG